MIKKDSRSQSEGTESQEVSSSTTAFMILKMASLTNLMIIANNEDFIYDMNTMRNTTTQKAANKESTGNGTTSTGATSKGKKTTTGATVNSV